VLFEPGTDERLAGILAADIAGFARLMEADEHATVAALEVVRRESVEGHRGRIDDMAGDFVLAVFDTAAAALRAALRAQSKLRAYAVDGLPERRMQFRIAVHAGDILERADGTVYGDGDGGEAGRSTLAGSPLDPLASGAP
jgi:adenylate cyclase